jgi:eukaryotic-like serine/threonine-protein kinase
LSQASYVLADRYRLDDRIATGGMGEVWRGVDLVLGRPVAVKLLRDDYAQHPETLERFRAEARHTAAVSHPGIARMYDYGEPRPGQPPFLVMELVDGVPLTELLARGPLDPARIMDLVAQTAAGLYAAHAVGLVHRDIKPGNLLVSPDGTVKITDFGIAYAAGSAPLTRTGALIGTPAYLAPERVTGASAGPASDLYSLGIVAYECLTGAQPFTGTPMEVALSHQYQPMPALPPAVPLPVAALVTELTARDPAVRPADAGEVAARAARLRDAMDGAAAQEHPWPASAASGDERWPAATRMEPGEPRLDGVTLRDVGLEGAGTHRAGMYGQEPPGHRGARRRAARRPARGYILLVLAAAAVAVIVGLTGWMLVSGASGAPPAPRHPAAARHPARPTTVAVPTVTVNAGALVGQPVDDVVRQLRDLGLKVKLTWVPNGQDHGTVLSVSPAGKVRVGATVTVTVAAHDHHDGGDGNGNGHGNGNGGG